MSVVEEKSIRDMSNHIVLTSPIYISGRDCGYCHGEKEERYAIASMKSSKESESITMGTSIQQMSCQDYDEFINMGFRRSGIFLYKTDMLRNCCRYYTIRTNTSHLKIEKKHRQVVNRFIRAISDEEPKSGNKAFSLEALVEAEKKSSRFYTRFEKLEFTQEKYQLYKKYQISVHNDDPSDITEEGFERFLCEHPFQDSEHEGTDKQWETLKNWKNGSKDNRYQRIGPTHECYYLDKKLIAISITDFLPSGVSSIYFIWDPDYAHLSLGTLSGLREMIMVQKLALDYYYLGYYIEDCEKMVYKGKFGGELLDLCKERYYPLSQVKSYIQNSRLFVMGTDDNTEPEMTFKYPGEGSSSDKNVVEAVYNNATFKTANLATNEIKPRVDFSANKFPNVAPGLMPMEQLLRIVTDKLVATFYHMRLGLIARDKSFKDMTNNERILVINCIRLFGPNRLTKLIILV